ncbi:MAG: histidine kinase [Bacteroidia bacterium]
MKKYIVVLLHLGYWLMFLFTLALFSLVDAHGKKIGVLSPAFIGAIIPASLGFYIFYGILFDKYLAKKKLIKLFLSIMLTILLSSVITEIILYLIYSKIDRSFNTMFFAGLFLSFISLINGILGMVMKGFITWYDDIKIKVELNKKNYEVELALMKAQLNPHFLFNTINNIDVLITKDAAKASAYLNKLSDIMRFMLYETKAEKIAFEKELEYIQKYIDLQKIRTSSSDYVNYSLKGDPKNLTIAPMLFIPFIENAFKHSETKKNGNAVNISFGIEKDKIIFDCENNYGKMHAIKEDSGLGNELIKKRLMLLYHEKHNLEITDKNEVYKVRLILNEN